ncbi:unnamed protein product, partial [Amoebophrya sp. A120]
GRRRRPLAKPTRKQRAGLPGNGHASSAQAMGRAPSKHSRAAGARMALPLSRPGREVPPRPCAPGSFF